MTIDKKSNISVSIIVPVYNVEQYLERCLNSLINQTLQNIEIICINDGSMDNSLSILKQYAEKDKRIKIIDQENQGVSVARNNGIEASQGEYIGFVDSDDYVDLDFFENLYNKAKKEDADIVEAKYYKIKKLKNNSQKLINRSGIYTYYNFCFNIYRRQFIKDNNIQFPIGIKIAEDTTFELEVLLKSNKTVILDKNKKSCYYYILRKNSATTNIINNIEDKFTGFLESVKMRINLLNVYGHKMNNEILDKYFNDLVNSIFYYSILYKIYDNNILLNSLYETIQYIKDNFNYNLLTNKFMYIELFKINNVSDLRQFGVTTNNYVSIFSKIKLLTIVKNRLKTSVRLFNCIEIFGIRIKANKKYIKLFSIPVISIIDVIK
ncbi:MAG: glycosyltransferase [Rickettsiales bacterium]|nr:glycosyltransferase [Rickettsiales bacterium]